VKRGILETFEHLCGAATTPAESMDSYGGTAGLHLDLQLQIFEKTGDNGFAHIPQVLWHFAPDVDNPAQNHTDILNAHFSRTGSNAFAVDHSDPFGKALPHASKIIWQQANEENPHQPSTGGTEVEKLAIIIPSKNALDLIRPCTESLIATVTATDQIEIIIMDNGSDDAVTLDWLKAIDNHPMVKVIRHDHPFNWAEINNNAVDHTDAKHLLFLNNDTLALEQGWDMVLRSLLRRSEIGAVGARLLYEDGTIQHGGVLLYDTSVAVHEAAGQTCDNPHYMFRSALPHHTSAVTGAFLACTKENFAQVHGFDEQFRIIFNDIDFCLKLRAQGLKILYSPDITFNHLESKSRGYDHQDSEKARRAKAESNKMKEKWGDTLKEDPYYPAIFARSGKPYSRIESLKQKI
jgi:GT2 family glycosyltransferase